MLFPYTYVPHQMEKMQEFIDFIFYEVWCKAPIGLVFHPDLFSGKPDLKEVISEFGFSVKAAESGKAFYKDVKKIYELFAFLSPQEIAQFKQWYQGNNDIEKVCANAPAIQLARYADIAVSHKDLSEQIAVFFKGLYDKVDLAAFKKKIGNIDDHYKAFMGVNKSGKCPFCGIVDMRGIYHSTRDAYDHYLPKGLYPFNSINFRNLVPACPHCNSSYKTSKDPACTPKDPAGNVVRRKVFYPFSTTAHVIDLQVTLQHADIEKMTSSDISLEFGPANIAEQIDTWKDVYGIEERYKAKCCGADAKDWLELVRILRDAHGITPDASLATVQQQAAKAPVANSNFLRRAFLEGCQRAGLLDAIASTGGMT